MAAKSSRTSGKAGAGKPRSAGRKPRIVRVHVQNPPPAPGALRLRSGRLQEAISRRSALKGHIEVSEDGGGEGLPPQMRDAEVLLSVDKVMPSKALEHAPGLKWMQTTFAGVEDIVGDVPAGLKLANASGVHAEKGGEFILAAALMLVYEIPRFISAQASQRWDQAFGPVMKTYRATILGVGEIGGSAANLLRQRGCHVTGVTRSGKARVKLDRIATLSELDAVLKETDILVSTLPDTQESRGLINRKRINLLPDGAGIIVVGRATPLDYEAIMDRLDAGTLSGAILDVFPKEPVPKGDRIWTTPGLIVSPHCSVDDHTTYLDCCLDIFLDNLERYLAGKKLRNLVDPRHGY